MYIHSFADSFLLQFIFGSAGLCCCMGFSLLSVSSGYSLVMLLGLPIAVASLVAEHGLQGVQASVVASHELSICGSQALSAFLQTCGALA